MSASALEDIIKSLSALPENEKADIIAAAERASSGLLFVPNPGPQTDAYFSEADETFYGGAAGGGKSALICGLAVDLFSHSHLFRRESTQLRGLVNETKRIVGHSDGLNNQDKVWTLPNGRVIEFAGVKDEDDKEKWQGRAAPLKAFDEITQFTETQYRYIIGWNRSSTGERCRVVATGNPPSTAEGAWVIAYWRPWLDPTHPNPAKPGELRWFTTIDGKDHEVPADYIGPKGERPRSRTFILSRLEDNPDLMETGYSAVIEGMPEPLRTMMREGRFDVGQQDDEWQVIPSEWIRAAQGRWKEDGYRGLRMTAVAVDVAQGGQDDTTLAPRYGAWFAAPIVKKGSETPDAPSVAGLVTMHRRDGAAVIIDLGGGYGGGAVSYLKDNGVSVAGFNGANASTARTVDRSLSFYNKRAEAWWRLREALDPSMEGGSPVALPPDPYLVADLTAPRWKLTPRGIQIEEKADIRKRIGRSPDRGDAVVMCWSEGQALAEKKQRGAGAAQPKVLLGYSHMKTRRRA